MTTDPLGSCVFVLHSHIPYCRGAGVWPHGEEWIHEAAVDTYLPLLRALWDLRDEGIPFRLTVGLTPILVEQLRDPLVNQHLSAYLERLIAAAATDERRGPAIAERAAIQRTHFEAILDDYRTRFAGDIAGAFKHLQDSGHVEIATSAATHGYLPLFDRDSTLAAQLGTGVDAYRCVFGRSPRAVWLPECAYRPALEAGSSTPVRPGIERFVAAAGLEIFFVETHTVEGGRPVGKAAGDALGPYGELRRRYPIERPVDFGANPGTTFEPYWVGDSSVSVLGRNKLTGLQVWSAEHGYPGNADYRDFHRRDEQSGLRYWRVTGRDVDLGDKDLYHPEWAQGRAMEHARHFASLVETEVARYHGETGRHGVVTCAYDTELFGHWWFEGIPWIAEVLRLLARSETVALSTASDFVRAHPPETALGLPESSWGQGGSHFVWLNPATEWMWPLIHGAERRIESLLARHPEPAGTTLDLIRQACREALLLQSSDWPFLITTGQAADYAAERFRSHLDRFDQLATILERSSAAAGDRALALDLFEQDKIFADIDYRRFASQDRLAGMRHEA